MDVSTAIVRYHFSLRGGVYRKLPLFTESCIAEGYGNLCRNISDLTYGPSGALGDARAMHTFYDIDLVIRNVAQRIRRDPAWVSRTRLRAAQACKRFEKELEEYSLLVQTDPERFLRFVIAEYPRYMGGIGGFNLFWRYLEFAAEDMPRFPRKGLRALSVERNKLAEIYPRCEKLIVRAIQSFGRKIHVPARLLLMMTRSELRKTLTAAKLAVPKKTLVKRASGYAYLYVNGKEFIQSGHSALATIRRHFAEGRKYIGVNALHGTTTSPGRIIGTVVKRIRRTSWPRNPILVVPMTHPNQIPFLRRIKGLVTDEGGGMLSHAAIVSRELKIPCVISTKIATKVLKDGDRVEVDATHGIVIRL